MSGYVMNFLLVCVVRVKDILEVYNLLVLLLFSCLLQNMMSLPTKIWYKGKGSHVLVIYEL